MPLYTLDCFLCNAYKYISLFEPERWPSGVLMGQVCGPEFGVHLYTSGAGEPEMGILDVF